MAEGSKSRLIAGAERLMSAAMAVFQSEVLILEPIGELRNRNTESTAIRTTENGSQITLLRSAVPPLVPLPPTRVSLPDPLAYLLGSIQRASSKGIRPIRRLSGAIANRLNDLLGQFPNGPNRV